MRAASGPRRFRRLAVRVLVDYRGPAGVRCDYATTLGGGGLFIESEDPLPEGTGLALRLRLPRGGTLHELEGRVVWCHRPGPGGDASRPPGMGVALARTPSSARLAREIEELR
jgi:uncharacterized protein (TIGR02266 family)